MTGIWSKIKLYAALAGAALVALGVAFLKGRAEGIRILDAERTRARLDAMKQRKDTDDEIAGLDATSVDSELAKWLRDKPDR